MTTTIEHQPYCGPRPGEDAPRIEKYPIPTYNDDGTTRVGSITPERCMECGETLYDGVKRTG